MGKGPHLTGIEPLLRHGPLKSLVEQKTAKYATLLRRAGEIGNPAALASASVSDSLKAAMLSVPLGVAGALYVTPWMLAVLAAPVFALAARELVMRDRVAGRREGVEAELPFFSVVVNVLAGAGVPLYSILEDIAGGDIFDSMKLEARLVRRDVAVFGMNPADSIERLASTHPSPRFCDFLLGYTSKLRSGGDVSVYLAGESGSLLKGLEEGWVRYVSRVGVIGSMMITAFGVVPLLLMVVGVFSPGFSIVGLVFFTGVGVPVLTIALLFLAGRMQPMRLEGVRGRAGRSVLVALPGILLGVLLRAPWASVAAFLLIFFVGYGLSVKRQLEETRELEEGLSRFLKDLLEYKRQDYDLTRAVVAIQAAGKFTPEFDRLLAKVAAQLRAGVPLDVVKVRCRSRMTRLSFLLLGQMSRSGGGTVDTVYQVSSFTDRMNEMRKNSAAEMKPYLILSYVSPLLLAFGVSFVGGLLSSFSRSVGPGLSSLHLGSAQIGAVPPSLSQVADLLIVVSAASLGLIGAKITDLTVKNTLKASTNVALATGAVALMALLGSHSLSQLL